MRIAKIRPLKAFFNKGESYKKDTTGYIDANTAKIWEKQKFARIEAEYDVEELVFAFEKNSAKQSAAKETKKDAVP